MEDIEQLKTDLDHLKAMQEVHRKQLEENRQAALQKKKIYQAPGLPGKNG